MGVSLSESECKSPSEAVQVLAFSLRVGGFDPTDAKSRVEDWLNRQPALQRVTWTPAVSNMNLAPVFFGIPTYSIGDQRMRTTKLSILRIVFSNSTGKCRPFRTKAECDAAVESDRVQTELLKPFPIGESTLVAEGLYGILRSSISVFHDHLLAIGRHPLHRPVQMPGFPLEADSISFASRWQQGALDEVLDGATSLNGQRNVEPCCDLRLQVKTEIIDDRLTRCG